MCAGQLNTKIQENTNTNTWWSLYHSLGENDLATWGMEPRRLKIPISYNLAWSDVMLIVDDLIEFVTERITVLYQLHFFLRFVISCSYFWSKTSQSTGCPRKKSPIKCVCYRLGTRLEELWHQPVCGLCLGCRGKLYVTSRELKLLKTSSSKEAHTFYRRLFSGTPCMKNQLLEQRAFFVVCGKQTNLSHPKGPKAIMFSTFFSSSFDD